LLDYDKDNDTLIMRATTASSTIGVGTKQLVEVQASKVENVNNLPIVVNGKQTTLGELRKNISPPVDNWSKYQRK